MVRAASILTRMLLLPAIGMFSHAFVVSTVRTPSPFVSGSRKRQSQRSNLQFGKSALAATRNNIDTAGSATDNPTEFGSITYLSTTRVGGANGGYYHRVKHESTATGTDMIFGLFLPSNHIHTTDTDADMSMAMSTPVLFWLSGLTCDDTNFAIKAGSRAFDAAEREVRLRDTALRFVERCQVFDSRTWSLHRL